MNKEETFNEWLSRSKIAEEQTVQQRPERVRLTNQLHIFADEVEVSVAALAERNEVPAEELLDWLTNELINRRIVCRLRP